MADIGFGGPFTASCAAGWHQQSSVDPSASAKVPWWHLHIRV